MTSTDPKDASLITPRRKDPAELAAQGETFEFNPEIDLDRPNPPADSSDEDSELSTPAIPPAPPVLAPTDKVSSALQDAFGVLTVKELRNKRANVLASEFIALAQGSEEQLDLKLLHLFHELEATLEDEGLNKFMKFFTVQYKANLGVQTKVNLNKVISACIMHSNPILESSSSKTLKLTQQFSKEVLLYINRKKYHDLMSTPISTVELGPFTPANKQRMWKDELCLASEVRHGWHFLQNIKYRKASSKDSGIRHIVDDFALIDEEHILKVNFNKINREASLAMFHALTRSCTKLMRDRLNMHSAQIEMQGPRALWYILKILTSRNTVVMKEFQTELSNLSESFSDRNYDLVKIAPELHRKILDYTEAGGPTFTIYDQVISGLRTVPCQAFVSALQLYEVEWTTTNKNKSPSALDLLQQILEMIKTLDANNQWPFHMGGKQRGKRKTAAPKDDKSSKKPKSDNDPDDLTAFKAEIKALQTKINSMDGDRGTSTALPPPKKTSTNKHAFNKHWGPNCYYKEKEHLSQFINGELGKKLTEMPKGTFWRWCDTCNRMGSHDTAHHRPNKSKSTAKETATGPPPPAAPSSHSPPPPKESSQPSSPSIQANAAAFEIHSVADDDDVEVEDFLAGCD